MHCIWVLLLLLLKDAQCKVSLLHTNICITTVVPLKLFNKLVWLFFAGRLSILEITYTLHSTFLLVDCQRPAICIDCASTMTKSTQFVCIAIFILASCHGCV